MIDLPYAVAGFCVGALVGTTGIGGGALMTPLLIMFFGVNPAVAIGTDLLFAALTKVVGVAVLGRRNAVDWPVVRALLAGSVPAALVATIAVYRLEQASPHADGVLKAAIGFVLLATSLLMFLKPRHVLTSTQASAPAGALASGAFSRTAIAGAVIGIIVASTSIGAGALGTMALILLFPSRWTPRGLVGTDLAHAIPLAVVAGAGHWAAGNFDLSLLGSLLCGSIPGVIGGALVAAWAPVTPLRLMIGAALLLSAIRLLLP